MTTSKATASRSDPRFIVDSRSDEEHEAGSSRSGLKEVSRGTDSEDNEPHEEDDALEEGQNEEYGLIEGMDPSGFAGPKVVKPLTSEALAAFKAAHDRAGVIYISRIPPGMRPTKVRHLMSQYGEVGRVYLQQEDAKRAYLRRKYTSTKKAHFTEGWVEFKDKKVARSIAEMLNAQPIGGKKGTRWRDDIWTMKYLPKFKWNMLTEQVAHEAAIHTARLRVELSQSKLEQKEYLKNVELARVLDKRAERARQAGKEMKKPETKERKRHVDGESGEQPPQKKRKQKPAPDPEQANEQLKSVLGSIF